MSHPMILLLEKSQTFPGLWTITGLHDAFLFDFQDILNRYRVVPTEALPGLLEAAAEAEYEVIFIDDPQPDFDRLVALDEPPEIELDSPFENAINGLLPFQVRAYNFLKDLPVGLMILQTGTGKGHLAAAIAKYHLLKEDVDHIVFMVKSHNKINLQRDLKERADLDSFVISGGPKQRVEMYKTVLATKPSIVITNYEKIKIDTDRFYWKEIFSGRVLCFYDEMPTKIKNRNTKLYRALRNLIYREGQYRSQSISQFMLTATPIETSPENLYNCYRLLNPNLLGSVNEFYSEYASSMNPFSGKPASWRNLDKLGLKLASQTYQISKDDPEIAAQFPKVITQELVLDWDETDRGIYEKLLNRASGIFQAHGRDAIFPLIMLMQLMCDLPSAINVSASTYSEWLAECLIGNISPQKGSEYARLFVDTLGVLKDTRHTKLEELRILIQEKYPNDKIIIFSTFNNLVLPSLSQHLDRWGVSHVVYRGTEKGKQRAQDDFKNTDTRVFLSSDAGSDSISLEEASIVVHYDLPWNASTYIQRQSRCHRITSTHENVRFITMVMEKSVEQRKLAIINRKKNYHGKVFGEGATELLTQKDLEWILFGG